MLHQCNWKLEKKKFALLTRPHAWRQLSMATAARTTRAGPPYQLDRSANAAVSGDATPRLINLAPASLLATTHHNQTGHTAPGIYSMALTRLRCRPIVSPWTAPPVNISIFSFTPDKHCSKSVGYISYDGICRLISNPRLYHGCLYFSKFILETNGTIFEVLTRLYARYVCIVSIYKYISIISWGADKMHQKRKKRRKRKKGVYISTSLSYLEVLTWSGAEPGICFFFIIRGANHINL